MKYISLLLALVLITFVSEARIWRINNIAGINADFTTFADAVNSSSVVNGDSLYFEPSASDYYTGSMTVTKRLAYFGPGYLLDPANTTYPGNGGLQVGTAEARISFFRLAAGAAGSKLQGLTLVGGVYFSGTSNIVFERVLIGSYVHFETGTIDNITIRKSMFFGNSVGNDGSATITNLVMENNVFLANAFVSLSQLSGSGNIFRNNSIFGGSNGFVLLNTYIANNIFGTFNQSVFTNSTLKNNIFQSAQALPGTATNNLLSQDMNAVYVAGSSGSLESRLLLKTGSPAIGAGLTVGSVVSPDCGAYGGPDPYKPSGIPNIPTIYSLTVPTSIPSGSATMNVSFSTRNNN